MKKDELNIEISNVLKRISYIEKLDKLLTYPEEYIHRKGKELKPVYMSYCKEMYSFGTERINREKGKYDIKLIAYTICEHTDPDKYFNWVLEVEQELKKNTYDDLNCKEEIEDLIAGYESTKAVIYDYVSVINYGVSIYDIYNKAAEGDERAIVKLIRVDKSAVTYEWCKELLTKKQYEGDWKFFRRIGRAIESNPYKGEKYLLKAILIAAYFWDSYFARLSIKEIVEYLIENDLIARGTDPDTFRRKLNRIGLRKHRYKKQDN